MAKAASLELRGGGGEHCSVAWLTMLCNNLYPGSGPSIILLLGVAAGDGC